MIKHNLDAVLLFFAALLISFLMGALAEASEGRKIFLTRCASCHNQNPTKPGSIGPDIADSSLELVTLKTQKREYPKGYIPKRKTRIMPRIPLNETQIKSVHEYIRSFLVK
jgi:mono/diheme cytochrome c family protein